MGEQKTHKPITFEGGYYRRGRRMLSNAIDIFNAAGINYHLDCGTLLGVARDGDLIPWDGDIDIGIMANEVEAVRKTFWSFRMRGWRVNGKRYPMPQDDIAWRRGDPRTFKIRDRRALLLRGRMVMDLFVKYPAEDQTYWAHSGQVRAASNHHFKDYELIEFAGRMARVPCDYEAYLTHLYGDWRKPKKAFIGDRDDYSRLRQLEPKN
jgi:lipopolysaccharide cholinephosphotransferase